MILNRLFRQSVKADNHFAIVNAPTISEVEAYYERETPMYLKTYGNIIQAARPTSDEEFLDYFIRSMNIEEGMKLLDAGCGVCGPSISFAQKKDINIDAITLNKTHLELAQENVSNVNLNSKINVRKGDFRYLDSIYSSNSYDIVFFLEVLGYSPELYPAIQGASNVLKQGGRLYIKDFFPVPLIKEEHLAKQLEITREIRQEYIYRLLDLVNLLTITRKVGLFVEFIRPFDVIEDFTKASMFENMNVGHKCYTKAITNPYQLYESLELRFRKII